MNKEIISVILPVYNGSATLMDTINSVLNQTFKDFKLYICNDHSNDNSEKIVKSFNSKKIYYVKNEKNIGLSKTRKKLLNLAAGNFIAFIDQDDIWIENKLEIQIKKIRQEKSIMCHTDYVFEHKELKINKILKSKNKISYNDLIMGSSVGASTVLFNKKKSHFTNKFCDNHYLDSMNDYIIWLDLLRPAKKNFYSIRVEQPLVRYSWHGKNLSRNKLNQLLKHFIIMLKVEKLPLSRCIYYSIANLTQKIYFYVK
jgi:glycosyltransferase involved in cell wall biosynthesis